MLFHITVLLKCYFLSLFPTYWTPNPLTQLLTTPWPDSPIGASSPLHALTWFSDWHTAHTPCTPAECVGSFCFFPWMSWICLHYSDVSLMFSLDLVKCWEVVNSLTAWHMKFCTPRVTNPVLDTLNIICSGPHCPRGAVQRGFSFLAQRPNLDLRQINTFVPRSEMESYAKQKASFWLFQNPKFKYHNTVSAISLLFRKLTTATMLNPFRIRTRKCYNPFQFSFLSAWHIW